MEGLVISFVSKDKQKSDYDWANIVMNDTRVGKARCLINGDELTIFSINIYPEFQGKGYGKEFVQEAKKKYNKIIADKVRFAAIGFWETLGFKHIDETNENWVYFKS